MLSNLRNIDVAILCGGMGTRLRSTIGEQQKTMAHINGQPFLDILLQYLAKQGAQKVVLCTGFQAQDIAAYYAKGKFGLTIDLSAESEPLGTGGALKHARPLIHSDPFIALNGDCFCELDYANFLASHVKRQAQMSLVTVKVADNKDFGSIATDPQGRILGFAEKVGGQSCWYINAGVYWLSIEAFDWMPAQAKFMLEKEFFPRQVNKRIFSYPTAGAFLDIGTPERFAQAQEILKQKG